jgi:hypothetical protein
MFIFLHKHFDFPPTGNTFFYYTTEFFHPGIFSSIMWSNRTISRPVLRNARNPGFYQTYRETNNSFCFYIEVIHGTNNYNWLIILYIWWPIYSFLTQGFSNDGFIQKKLTRSVFTGVFFLILFQFFFILPSGGHWLFKFKILVKKRRLNMTKIQS